MKNYVQLNSIIVDFTRIDIVLWKYKPLYFTNPSPPPTPQQFLLIVESYKICDNRKKIIGKVQEWMTFWVLSDKKANKKLNMPEVMCFFFGGGVGGVKYNALYFNKKNVNPSEIYNN